MDETDRVRAKLLDRVGTGAFLPGKTTLKWEQLDPAPRLELEQMAFWFRSDHRSEAIGRQVEQVLRGAVGPLQRVRRIFNYVARLKNADRGNSGIPAPTYVLSQRRGDCAGKSGLLACMLDCAGFDTRLVAVVHEHVFIAIRLPRSLAPELPIGAWVAPDGDSLWLVLESAQGNRFGWMRRDTWETAFLENRIIGLELWLFRQPRPVQRAVAWIASLG